MMEDAQSFNLAEARGEILQALEETGYDVISDREEPNLLQARRDANGSSSSITIDSSGQLRYTITRQTGPERVEKHRTSTGETLQVTRENSETLTLSYQLDGTQMVNFAHFMTELDKI